MQSEPKETYYYYYYYDYNPHHYHHIRVGTTTIVFVKYRLLFQTPNDQDALYKHHGDLRIQQQHGLSQWAQRHAL